MFYSVLGSGAVPANAADFDGGALPTNVPVSILGGQLTTDITINVAGDTIVETNESFRVQITIDSNINSIVVPTATGTIQNDDAATLAIAGVTASEGDAPGTTAFDFVVTLTGDVQDGFTVDYATTHGSTTAADFSGAISGTSPAFTGTSGETQNVTITVQGDDVVETDETFTVTLGTVNPVSADAGDITSGASNTGTIQNDDAATLSIAPVTQAEGSGGGTTNYDFVATLTGGVQDGFDVAYATTNGSTAAGDFAGGLTGTLTFAGTNLETQTATIVVNADDVVEIDETFTVTLGVVTPVTADAGDITSGASNTGTIQNDDTATFTINDVSVNESTGTVDFTVSLDTVLDIPVDIDVIYADGTATGGGTDYDSATDTVSFPAGSTAGQTATVAISDDTIVELDETFAASLAVNAGTPVGARSVDLTDTGTGTITSDNDTATFTINDVSVNESAGTLDFTVSLSNPVDIDVDVDVSYTDVTTAAGDFDHAIDTVTFPAGSAAGQTATVAVTDDAVIEADESFTASLTINAGTPVGGRTNDLTDTGIGEIVNDDTATLTITDVSLAEGSGGGFTNFDFTVTSPVEVQDGFSLAFTVNDGTATDADDFDVVTTSPVAFFGTAGETQTIRVAVVADDVSEDDETFTVTLGALSNIDPTAADDITTGAVGNGTIVYDDYEAFMGADITVAEVHLPADNTVLTFTVNLDRPNKSGSDINLRVTTSDDTATAGSDYTALSNFNVAVADTEQSETFNVEVLEDTLVENDEVFFVDLTTASGNTIVQALPNSRAVGTITNDDQATLAIDDVIASEGADTTTTTYTFTVTLTGDVDQAFTVDWATADASAISDTDFLSAGGTLNFAGTDGETQTLDVTVNGDDEVEYDETFFVNLSNIAASGKNVIFSDATGAGSILSDNKYRVTIDDVSVDEPDGAAATTPATFTISLHQAVLAGQVVTVGYQTSGTATEAGHTESPIAVAGTDYTAIALSTVNFNATDTSKTIDVTVLNEALDVDLEYYYVNISAGSINAQIDDSTGLGTIVDNEYEVVASVDAVNNPGDICRGATCADPDDIPPDSLTITEIIERSSDSSVYTVTADSGYCIADVTRDGSSVLGGIVPISPYPYTATNIQNDPTTIVASFRSEIQFTTNIEPLGARTYGRWRLKDTTNNVYILPGAGFPTTADPTAAWLNHGDTVVIPCDQSGYDLEYKEVSGWFKPATVNYSIPPAAGANFTATGTYVSKTVKLTLSESGGTGSETIDVDPTGTDEGGPGTQTYLLVDNETVTLTANSSVVVGSETIFLRWIGPVADEFASSTTVLMDADKTVTAVFGLPGVDNDGDGYEAGLDCDDTDATVHPDATELCGDGIDQDCTGGDPVCVGPDADDDGDGYTENQGDCNDSNAAINPDATEICGNAVDEDCYDGPRDYGTEVICSDYAERPLETQAQSAAPMVMFVLDDSGSMDWTMMTEESDGLFDDERYVWSVGDNQYSQVLSASERKEWRSQYYAYNFMYYNPNTDYVPWPQWNTSDDTEGTTGTKIKDGGAAPPIDADLDDPRSNPVRDDWTLNMDTTFFSVLPATAINQWISVERHGGSDGNSTLADAVKLVGTGYAGDPDTFASDAAVLANNNLIVDNEPDQADHTFIENGNWSTSGSPNPWDENARYTTGNNSAVWRFSVPIAGTYDVYARWNEYNQRDRNARYTVVSNNGGSTVTYDVNQRLNGDSWVQLATGVTFAQQDNTNPGAIEVKNAHYFTWYDADTDDTIDAGEVYLVNLGGSAGTYTMDFYQFNDDGDNVVEDGELIGPVTSGPAFDAIQPRTEGGTLRTPTEERQNIANWWSFYRRRELTAKAAIGRTISGTEGMHIGIMGINGRIEEELVPIGVESTLVKTLDNQDASYSDTGSWSESGSPNEFSGSSFFTSNSGDTARWTPTFTAGEAGAFRVYAWWNCFSNRDEFAKYTVVDKDGSTDYLKDQRSGLTTSQCGQWVELGIHLFDESGGQYVEVARHAGSNGSSTNADAVRFASTGATVNVNQTPYILNELYQVNSSSGTPLRRGLQNAGKYFDHEDSGATGGLNSVAPWASAADGGGCQRAFAILMTDGYYNGSDPSPSVGNEDSDGNRPSGTNANGIGGSTYDSNFYAGTGSNTLGDVAMYYYEKDLHGGLANDIAPVNYDLADHQHMVTYGVSFGVKGTLDPATYPNCLPDTPPTETAASCPSWPTPDSNARKIDDLYHASVNGRGKYLNAANPGELVEALKEIIEDVADKTGTGASVSINAQELKEGTLLFQASYETGSWRGDMQAKTLDPNSGEIVDTLWSAAEQLFSKTHDTRKIVTYNGTVGKHFRFDTTTYTSELTDAQIKKLLNLAEARDLTTTPLTAGEETDLENLVDYLRGDGTNEGTTGGTFRQRARKDGTTDIGVLGDIVHSAPLHVGNVVYVGGNDGMLHAFDDTTGEELWAYVPNLIYDDLDDLAGQSYQHNFYVDNSPFSQVITDSGGNSTTLLVGTLGRGGQGVYALDISSSNPSTEADAKALVKWEYPTTPGSDFDLGYGYGRAFTVNSHLDDGGSATRYVTIIGNGYQSANGKAMLYVLDAHTGTLLGKLDTGVGSPAECNGLSVPVLIDPDFDGVADFAYAGDLLGNMWKFDLRGNSISDWKIAYNTQSDGLGTAMPMFQAKNKQGHRQPITTKPDVMAHPDASLGGYMVIFGTGRYLGNADFGENSIQTIYGIWDWQKTWEVAGSTSPDKYYGDFGPVATGDPLFGRLSYTNKPVDDDFAVGQTVTGFSSGATGVIEEIEDISDTAGTLKLINLSVAQFQNGEFITSTTVTADARADAP